MTALLDGTFSDNSRGCAAAGTVLAADTAQAPQFACPTDSGRACTGAAGSVAGVGPAADMLGDASSAGTEIFRVSIALDASRTQMLINGVPISSGTDFSGVQQVDGQHVRLACDLSFITPLAPPAATITMNQSFVVRPHPTSDATTDTAVRYLNLIPDIPNGSSDLNPTSIGRIDVERTGTLVDAALDFVHQAWAVGVLNDGSFTPVEMTNLGWQISFEGPDR